MTPFKTDNAGTLKKRLHIEGAPQRAVSSFVHDNRMSAERVFYFFCNYKMIFFGHFCAQIPHPTHFS